MPSTSSIRDVAAAVFEDVRAVLQSVHDLIASLRYADPAAMEATLRREVEALDPPHVYHGASGPYLSRWTLARLEDGGEIYLHHFHRADEDRDGFHNHPWRGTGLILLGGYWEERLAPDDGRVEGAPPRVISPTFYGPGDLVHVEPDTFHRLDRLGDEARGSWSFFAVGPRLQSWGFKSRTSGEFVPWEEQLIRRGITPHNREAR